MLYNVFILSFFYVNKTFVKKKKLSVITRMNLYAIIIIRDIFNV